MFAKGRKEVVGVVAPSFQKLLFWAGLKKKKKIFQSWLGTISWMKFLARNLS